MTETDVQTETAPEAPEQPASGALTPGAPGPSPAKEAIWTRLVLPFALPILSAIAVGLWALNLSRVFLASSKDGALVVVLIVTVTIMVGATVMSASARMRASNQTMLVSAAIVLIISAGFVTITRSEEHEASGPSGYVEPKAAATGTLAVDALPSLAFQAKDFTVPAGVTEFDYVDKGGTHTLNFDTSDPNLKQFELTVPTGKHVAKVDLKPGKYVIYCSIPGHRAAGMEATVTVG